MSATLDTAKSAVLAADPLFAAVLPFGDSVLSPVAELKYLFLGTFVVELAGKL